MYTKTYIRISTNTYLHVYIQACIYIYIYIMLLFTCLFQQLQYSMTLLHFCKAARSNRWHSRGSRARSHAPFGILPVFQSFCTRLGADWLNSSPQNLPAGPPLFCSSRLFDICDLLHRSPAFPRSPYSLSYPNTLHSSFIPLQGCF